MSGFQRRLAAPRPVLIPPHASARTVRLVAVRRVTAISAIMLQRCRIAPAVRRPASQVAAYSRSLAKNFGQGSGVSGAENALAWRLGSLQRPQKITAQVPFDLTSAPNAVQAAVTVTQPTGAVTRTVCSSSPCAVTVDERLGDQVLKRLSICCGEMRFGLLVSIISFLDLL